MGVVYSLTDIVWEEHYEEWSDEIVDSLDIAAGRMPHGPYEQYPLEALYRRNYDKISQFYIMLSPEYILTASIGPVTGIPAV